MVLAPTTEVIPLTVDAHGVLRVGNTRVTLETLLAAFADGATAEEIVQQYPSLHLADVYSVIGYYLRHTAEVDVYIQQRHRQRETVRQKNEARCGSARDPGAVVGTSHQSWAVAMRVLAADEHFNGNIVRGLFRRQPALDLGRLQDVGLSGTDDPAVLAWAAHEGRVLLTHDVSTITQYAYERVQEGQPMLEVFEVSRDLPIGRAIEEILLLAECSLEGEWEGQVRYLPLR